MYFFKTLESNRIWTWLKCSLIHYKISNWNFDQNNNSQDSFQSQWMFLEPCVCNLGLIESNWRAENKQKVGIWSLYRLFVTPKHQAWSLDSDKLRKPTFLLSFQLDHPPSTSLEKGRPAIIAVLAEGRTGGKPIPRQEKNDLIYYFSSVSVSLSEASICYNIQTRKPCQIEIHMSISN